MNLIITKKEIYMIINKIKFYSVFLFFLLLLSSCMSQENDKKITIKNPINYSFCRNYNHIDTVADTVILVKNIENFYKKLPYADDSVITIVHIGDSHLQAGFLGNELRKKLLTEFGNAGRGLIFPFNLYKSNQPNDFSQKTTVGKWNGTNIVQYKQKYPSGINAAVLQTEDTGNICFSLKNNNIDNSFDKVTVFTPKLDSAYDYIVYNSDNKEKTYSNYDSLKNKRQYFFDSLSNSFCIDIEKTADNQKQFLLHGILLEKQKSNGILYNDIGINGATINNYNNSPLFFEQLKELNPSLMIISLGSNDAASSNVKREVIKKQLRILIDKLRQENPDLSIILVTPVHHYFNKTLPHAKLETEFCNAIYDIAIEKKCAVIDLFGIGGGPGSCKYWKEKKLLQSDGMHFTVEGYKIHANLIYNAIINGIH